jgi:diguanylate cyclase (GGDEF)-like protein
LNRDGLSALLTKPFDSEKHYAAIIDSLRRMIVSLSAETSFDAEVLTAPGSFLDFTQAEDLSAVRQKLERELAGLESAVEAKRTERDLLVTQLSDRLDVVQKELTDTRNRLRRSENEITRDPLTGIANRRHFDRQLDLWVSRRSSRPFVLAMIDVDHFKGVNDRYGHQTGDQVLTAVTKVMRRMTRGSDLVARYGGEEFAILFSNMTLERARERSWQIMEAVRKVTIDIPGGFLGVTLSCGLAILNPEDTPRTLLERADFALYDAKRLGRNRIESRTKTRTEGLEQLQGGGQ